MHMMFRNTILKVNFVTTRASQLLQLQKYNTKPAIQRGMELRKTEWDPLQIYQCPTHYKYAVVILNCPIFWKHDILLQLWKKAQVTVTVDGGTLRWLEYLEEQGIHILDGEHGQYIPDLITGDMDSCSSSILKKMMNIGSTIIKTPDQNHTDYSKALMQLKQFTEMKSINLNGIYVFAEPSGRFDHIIGNVNTLYKSDNLVGNTQVFQVASNSLTWLLKPGFHRISIPNALVLNNSWCGLLPFGSPVKNITTTGLKWNLNNSTLEFGGLVSTSNTYDNCSEVTINTDSPVVWSMGIETLHESMNDKATL